MAATTVGTEVEITVTRNKTIRISVAKSFAIKDSLKSAGYKWNDRMVAWEKETEKKTPAVKAEIDFIRTLDKEPSFTGQPSVLRVLADAGVIRHEESPELA